jgi:hypothetical protein
VPTFPGGFGRQGFGLGGFGFGGPLTVVRAIAVAGQVVRVVFNEEPNHRSPAGATDALNPSNFILTVPGGNATAPMPVGVDRDPIVGPAYGVGNGGASSERGMDVHVDRQLISGVQYNIRVRKVVSLAGDALGTPDNGNFMGVTVLLETKKPDRNQDLVDFANPPAVGHWIIDDSGDIAPELPADGTKKRTMRRVSTKRNAFRTLPDYGVRLDHKGVGSTTKLTALRADAIRQLAREPDVAQVDVQTSLAANGVTTIAITEKTKRGTFVEIGAQISAVGAVTST